MAKGRRKSGEDVRRRQEAVMRLPFMGREAPTYDSFSLVHRRPHPLTISTVPKSLFNIANAKFTDDEQ